MVVVEQRRHALRRGVRLEPRSACSTRPTRGSELRDQLRPDRSRARTTSRRGGGRRGLVLDEANDRLYVLTRFDNAVSRDRPRRRRRTLASACAAQPGAGVGRRRAAVPLRRAPSPRATAKRRARAATSSATSTASPGTSATPTTRVDTQHASPIAAGRVSPRRPADFHPMKGPMTTQTLRGLATHGAHALARRPRRRLLRRRPCSDLDSSAPATRSSRSSNFIVAFEGLVGRDGRSRRAEMQQFTDFALQLTLPPNPVRALDNSLTADGRRRRLLELRQRDARRHRRPTPSTTATAATR